MTWGKLASLAIEDAVRQMAKEYKRSRTLEKLILLSGKGKKQLEEMEKRQQREQEEYAEWFATLKVGDEVAHGGEWTGAPSIETVVKVGHGFVTIHDGERKIRVSNRNDTRLSAVTDETRQRIERHAMLKRLGCYSGDYYDSGPPDALDSATIPQLRKIVKILGV